MAKRNYIFTNKKHPLRAIMATILGAISIVSLIVVVHLAYQKGGNIPTGYGVTGLLATLFSFVGLIMGIVTEREKEYYRLFPRLAILLNLLALTGISLILYFGSNY